MKKLTKKTLMAIFALVLAVVALGTTSYAWFTVGQTVTVNQIELDVRSEDGLWVQYLGKNESNNSAWTQNLETDEILAKLGADYGSTPFVNTFKFDHVTSTDGKAFKSFNTDSAPTLVTIDQDANGTFQFFDSGILEFRLNFKTQATGAPKLAWTGVTLTSSAITDWKPSKSYTHNKYGALTPADEAKNYYVHDAARISLTSGATTVVYEAPDSTSNSVLGTGGGLDFDTGSHGYYKAVTGTSLASLITGNTPVATQTEINGSQFKVNFGAAEPNGDRFVEVTVRVYLEGFDYDTLNAILSGKLTIGLQFKLSA